MRGFTMKRPTYKVLRQILTELEFTFQVLPKGHFKFDDRETDTTFVFVPMGDDDLVPMHYVVLVREFLYLRGLMEHEEFDELLRERSVAG